MACRTGRLPDGTMFVACSRGPASELASCSAPGCRRPHVALCDHPVTREGKAGTCDAKLCDAHRKAVGEGKDLCLPHARSTDGVTP